MVDIVLDASAVLRYLDREAGGDRVAQAFQDHTAGRARIFISALHWGEVIGIAFRRNGQSSVDFVRQTLDFFKVQIVVPDRERCESSALIHVTKKIPYVDSFAVELCQRSSRALLITADFDFKPAEQDIQVEFLPTKP